MSDLIPQETKNKIDEALEFFNSLKEIQFTNQQQYDNGVELIKKIKTHSKQIEKERLNLTKPYNDKVKSINAICKDVTNKLDNAEKVLKKGMADYFAEQQRIAEEKQKKINAEIEAKRQAELKRAEAERKKADSYRYDGREQMAENAEARAETAEALAGATVAPVIENKAKTSGVLYKTTYMVEIKNEEEVIRGCLDNPILKQFVNLDVGGIKKLAQSLKGKLECPGIRVYEDKQVSIRI